MTAQQRDMVDQILRDAPFDLGGDVAVQRPLLDQMLTSQPRPADVRTTTGDLGGVPVIFIDGHKAFKYHMDEREFLRKLAS